MIKKDQNNNIPEIWEDIKKVKTSEYPKNQEVSDALANSKPEKTPGINILEAIYKNNQKHYETVDNPIDNPPKKHGNLMSIVRSKDLIRYSYNKLSKNKGALTPGTTNETADQFSEEKVQEIHTKLKSNQFKWTRIRRIYIPKPGKTVLRPLGIPSFTDKIVQNNIMMILTSIYEPEFEHVDSNYGFRPNKSCNSAIRRIRINAHGMDQAIEADIVGAYNNVQHEILIDILRKRINDEKFLDLIRKGLKCGILTEGIKEDSPLGTPQGGIASPILFNIYMNEFDKHIKYGQKIQTLLNPPTAKTGKSTEYKRWDMRLERNRKHIKQLTQGTGMEYMLTKINAPKWETLIKYYNKKLKKLTTASNTQINNSLLTYVVHEKETGEDRKLAATIKNLIVNQNLTEDFKTFAQEELQGQQKEILKQRQQTSYYNPDTKLPGIIYIRYADDWILFVRGNEELTNELKNETSKWLEEKLGLQLSPEKTKITTLKKDKARFLGFEIFKQKNLYLKTLTAKSGVKFQQRFGTNIQISPDTERLTSRFTIKNITTKNGNSRSQPALTLLPLHQIIQKYNQFMIGLGNYYITEIDRPSTLSKWHYLLYYSCLKTIAHKLKITVRQVIKKYGYLDISNPYRNNNPKHQDMAFNRRIIVTRQQDNKTIYYKLLNYNELQMQISKLRKQYRNKEIYHAEPIDFNIMKKSNWRTKFKLTQACIKCGSKTNLENHHIKPMKDGKFKGFDKIVVALNRKQITICRECHRKIHKGQYNGISLEDLYDVQLAIVENKLNYKTEKDTTASDDTTSTNTNKIVIDPKNRTYFNPELRDYFKIKGKTTKKQK